jgi:hypothetical protein
VDRKQAASQPVTPAEPNIEQALAEFLEAQRARLGPKTLARYRDVIELFTHCLNGYGHQHLDKREAALFDRLYNAEGAEHRDFCEVFGPEKIPGCFSEFLGWFMIRHVMAGTELMRAAGTVTKKLAAWLGERGYISADAAAAGVAEGAEAARDLPQAERLARQLHAYCEDQPTGRFDEQEEGHFTITRVEPGLIWLESMAGDEFGPIQLPQDLTRLCREGWDISGALAWDREHYYLSDVWNVYP